MSPEEALSGTLAEIAPQIAKRKLSPVALAEASLRKLESVGRSLNAVANLTRERALEEAKAAERQIAAGRYRGPLHGVPYGAKDLLAAKGAPTTWGAGPLADQMLEEDAVVIRRLREAGAVLVAKLAMIELAGGLGYSTAAASATGPAKNPWDRSRWTCGSSSGSAAATAAGLVSFAIGSETWGSILCPSSFCGVTGLRPTYGRVPRTGAMALSWTMDKIGPIARSAEDCQTVLAAIAGYHPGDSTSLQAAADLKVIPHEARSYRVGVVRLSFEKSGDREVEAAFEEAVRRIAWLGCKIAEAKLPDLPFEEAATVFVTVEAVAAFEPLFTSGKVRGLVDPSARLAGEAAKTVTGADYVRAMQARRIMQQELENSFTQFDVLISPTVPFLATKIDQNLEETFAAPDPVGGAANLAGLPALSVPCGFSKSNLPIGMQIVAPPLEEKRVLALGRLYQQNTDWHRRRPPAA